MEEIKDIVKKVVENLSSQGQSEITLIHGVWKRILNRQELKHSKLTGIKDDTLYINVDSPAWFYQFNLNKQKILERLQKEFPYVKKIYFKIGYTK